MSETRTKPRSRWADLVDVLRNVSPWKGRYAVGLFMSSAGSFGQSLFVGMLIGGMLEAAQGGDAGGVLRAGALWAAMIVASLVVGAIGKLLFEDARRRAASRLRCTLFSHMLRLGACESRRTHSGEQLSRLDSDASACNAILERLLGTFVGMILSLVMGVATVGAIHWQIPLALLSVGAFMLILNLFMVNMSKKRWEIAAQQRGVTVSYLSDLLAGAQLVRIYGEDTGLMRRFIDSCRAMFHKNLHANRASAIYYGFNQVNAGLTIACSIGLGLWFYRNGLIGIAALPVLIQVGSMVVKPISDIGWLLIDLQESLTSAHRVAEVFAKPEEDLARGASAPEGALDIRARDLGFAYEDGKALLKSVDFAIPQGSLLGIAGYSGSGKSTLLRLLMGMDAYEGSLTIGGRELRDLSLASLRALSAYVPQECPLFDGTILENIRVGRLDATDEQAMEAARAADVDSFVRDMPDGYQTLVGENGVKLSGGQRQRIAIARAFLKDAPLLLLDEVSASLDSASEQRVQAALERLVRGRTTIIVAHRLSTIRDADEIWMMEDGRIVERGGHAELLARDGAYASLYRLQTMLAQEA